MTVVSVIVVRITAYIDETKSADRISNALIYVSLDILHILL